MTNQKRIHTIALDAAPKGKLKGIGGAARDEWNIRLVNLIASALPISHTKDPSGFDEAVTAALSGVADINPADPIEGTLAAQMVVANEAALSMYRHAWMQPPECFEARTKYLSLADKATRTVALLTERLDQHRSRGQQQITVKHVTVNADQAIVADQVVSGKPEPSAAKLVTATNDQPMEIVESRRSCQWRGEAQSQMTDNPMHKAHAAPRCHATSKRTGLPCRSPAVRGFRVCRMHGARGGAPEGERNGNYRHGARTKQSLQIARLIKTLARSAR